MEAAPVEVADGRSRNGPDFQAKSAPLLSQALEFLPACLTTLSPDPDVVRSVVLVPDVMHGPATINPHDGDILLAFNVANDFVEGNQLWSNLVTARRHHPFFEIGSGNAGDRAVLLDPKKHHAALEIAESYQLFGEGSIVDRVALELDSGSSRRWR